MNNAIFKINIPANEPILGYLKGSKEQIALTEELKKQSETIIEIPLIINGQEIKTGKMGEFTMPCDHKHVLARYHMAGENEVKMAMMLSHPNLVAGVDMGEFAGYNYLAMKYIEGTSIQHLLDERRVLTEKFTIAIGRQIVQALDYAWQQEILHRDIKPDNLLISRKTEADHYGSTENIAYLIDLGIAKFLLEDTSLTLHGRVVGTPHYMSPEQASGVRQLDFRSDLYSLGATMYHMLSGRVPFDGASALVIMNKVKDERPINLTRLRPDLLPATTRIVGRLMSKNPDSRYQSHEALADDLQRIIDGKEAHINIRIRHQKKIVEEEYEEEKPKKKPQKTSTDAILGYIAIGFVGGFLLGVAIGWLVRLYLK